MALRTCAWVTLVAFTAIVPGGIAGILGHARRWTPERCARVARIGGWTVVTGCALIAFLMSVEHPFGWVLEPWGNQPALLAGLIWMAIAEEVPRRIAQRIAFPKRRA